MLPQDALTYTIHPFWLPTPFCAFALLTASLLSPFPPQSPHMAHFSLVLSTLDVPVSPYAPINKLFSSTMPRVNQLLFLNMYIILFIQTVHIFF